MASPQGARRRSPADPGAAPRRPGGHRPGQGTPTRDTSAHVVLVTGSQSWEWLLGRPPAPRRGCRQTCPWRVHQLASSRARIRAIGRRADRSESCDGRADGKDGARSRGIRSGEWQTDGVTIFYASRLRGPAPDSTTAQAWNPRAVRKTAGDAGRLGRVHTKRSASKMSANEMNPRKITSSFSKREKMRRNPFNRRNSLSISLRLLYISRSYSHG